jgi:ligand-binding sensor domain-containing protein
MEEDKIVMNHFFSLCEKNCLFCLLAFAGILSGCSQAVGMPSAGAASEITAVAPAGLTPSVQAVQSSETASPAQVLTASPTAVPAGWRVAENWKGANQIRALLADQSGNIWAGGPGGVVSWDINTGQPSIYVVDAKPEKSDVVAIAQTADRGIWVGTFGNGILRIDDKKQWQTFTTKDNLPSNYIASLVSASDGMLWVSTSFYARDEELGSGGHFGQFDGSQWIASIGRFDEIVAAPNGDLWGLAMFQIGQRWESVVAVFRDDQWNTVNVSTEPNFVTAMTVDPDGMVWAAARTGVFRFDGTIWQKITPPWGEEIDANVTSIAVTSDGTAWFGFSVGEGVFGPCGDRMIYTEEIGVYRYDGQSWTHFTTADGLVDNKICAITIGPDGNVWFGSFDQGLSRFDGTAWTSYIIR